MVNVRHPAVLSSGNGFQSTLGRLRTFRLELMAHFLEFMSLSSNLFTRDELRLALFVIADSQETKSTVNTNDMADILFLEIFDSFYNRNMEIPQSLELN